MAQLIRQVEQDLEPTDEEVEEYAEFLGVSLEFERDLLTIAKCLLMKSLPAPWEAYREEGGHDDDYFYFNTVTGESTWDHPLDEPNKQEIEAAREKRRLLMVTLAAQADGCQVDVTATSMAGEVLATASGPSSDRWDTLEERFVKQIQVDEGVTISFLLPDGQRISHSARSQSIFAVLL